MISKVINGSACPQQQKTLLLRPEIYVYVYRYQNELIFFLSVSMNAIVRPTLIPGFLLFNDIS